MKPKLQLNKLFYFLTDKVKLEANAVPVAGIEVN